MAMTLSKRQSQIAWAGRGGADFDALFQQHWERMCSVLFRMLGDWHEAEDLALETFMQLYQKPPAQENNLGGWLYRVATNLGLNALRARKRRQRYEEEAGAWLLESDPSQDPASVIERTQERQRVRIALGSMKLRSAQVLVLRHSGMSYAEIAGAIDVSPASVGTLLARAEREFEQLYRKA
jgi:RNA polymerase sigma-70 factor, ECF subfamily